MAILGAPQESSWCCHSIQEPSRLGECADFTGQVMDDLGIILIGYGGIGARWLFRGRGVVDVDFAD
jgi:hypothetical protein